MASDIRLEHSYKHHTSTPVEVRELTKNLITPLLSRCLNSDCLGLRDGGFVLCNGELAHYDGKFVLRGSNLALRYNNFVLPLR